MGIYDRDYYRNSAPRGGFGHFVAWSLTTWLIVFNVAVFFVDGAMRQPAEPARQTTFDDMQNETPDPFAVPRPPPVSPLMRWGAFSIDTTFRHFQFWRLITYQFLPISIGPLLVNMLGIFFFGPIVEAHFGSRRFLAFYLLCGIAGAIAFTLLEFSHISYINLGSPLAGASAGVFGLLVAAAIISPHVQIFHYIIPVTILGLAIGAMVLSMYAIIAAGIGAVEAANFGGGAMGYLFMRNQHWLNVFAPRRVRPVSSAPPSRRRPRPAQKDWSKDFNR
jgi:membrane associated rhomboid family serine protease